MAAQLVLTARAGQWQSGVTLATGDYRCLRDRPRPWLTAATDRPAPTAAAAAHRVSAGDAGIGRQLARLRVCLHADTRKIPVTAVRGAA